MLFRSRTPTPATVRTPIVLLPANAPLSVPVKTYVAITGSLVKLTEAIPDPSVVDVAAANVPLVGDRDQVTTLPAVATGASFASINCALTDRGVPATGADGVALIRYFTGVPDTKFTVADCVSATPPSDAVTAALCTP